VKKIETYDSFRPQIKSGDLLGFQHNQLGWGIEDIQVRIVGFFEKSDIVHAGTACWLNGRLFVLEAVSPYPRIALLSNRYDFYHLPLSAPWAQSTQDFGFSLLGNDAIKYSRAAAIAAGLHKLPPPTKYTTKWECAQLSWMIAHFDGIDLGPDLTPDGLMAYAGKSLGLDPTLVLQEKDNAYV